MTLRDYRHGAIRQFYKVINPGRKLYWFVARPRKTGVKCVIECDGKILLGRLTYAHKKWTVPGGGVKATETLEEAAMREAREEVGVSIDTVEKIGVYYNDREYKRDTVHCFVGRVANRDHAVDGLEVSEAKWFSPKELPDDRAQQVQRIVDMYVTHVAKNK